MGSPKRETDMRSTEKPTALAAFMARKLEIDTMLKRLIALSDDHFDVGPDKVHWGMSGRSRIMPSS